MSESLADVGAAVEGTARTADEQDESRSQRWLREVLDAGSFLPWQAPQSVLSDVSDSPGYRQERAGAAQRSGVDESIVTGEGLIGGHRVAVVCSEFSFLAGSIGRDAAGRVLAALQRATTEGLPVIAAPASGGTRMQEGTPAFLRMVSISNAVTKHKAAGLPYLVYLRHPVTGGVLASWGSLGHLTFAEPGALVGFLGPKVYRALTGIDFPRGVQIAENLYEHGIVDAVVTADEFAATVGRFLSLLRQGPGKPDDVATYKSPERPAPEAWHAVESTRLPERPGVVALIRQQAIDVVELSGSGEGNRGGAVVLCLARFGSSACVVVGQDRAAPDEVPLNADSLATARRGMRLAAELGLPLVTVVDTPGAVLSPEAEEAGLAGQIARCLADLGALPVPTLSVLLGQGCGGGALALLPADRVLAAENAWLTPLPPEGASAIVHGTPDRAPELAAEQRIHSIDLLETGAVDRIVPEQPDASREPETFLRRIARAIDVELADMPAHAIQERIDTRMTRWHSVGL